MNGVSDRSRFDRILIEADDLSTLDPMQVQHTVEGNGLACIRGLHSRSEVQTTLRRIRERFDASNDRKHDPADTEAVRGNLQKLQIGANSGVNSMRTLGRFMRAIYNPIFADDVLGMRNDFIRLARLRNRLYGLADDFAVTGTQEGFWTCSRLLQYPAGGGFMVPHRDVYSQLATTSADLGYYQLLMLMTEQGRDYDEGGGYVDHDGYRFRYEPFTHAGDVIVYDGRSIHGVADVDPMSELELQRFTGRVAALVSLFRYLAPDTNAYGAMSTEGASRFT
ncbi:MAG: hypothetical protein R3F12_06340 [Lysobacteraceae bacterium]